MIVISKWLKKSKCVSSDFKLDAYSRSKRSVELSNSSQRWLLMNSLPILIKLHSVLGRIGVTSSMNYGESVWNVSYLLISLPASFRLDPFPFFFLPLPLLPTEISLYFQLRNLLLGFHSVASLSKPTLQDWLISTTRSSSEKVVSLSEMKNTLLNSKSLRWSEGVWTLSHS